MEVNVIFENKIEIDNKNNFRVNFLSENRIMSLLLNRKKDYYLTNAIAFIENKKPYKKEVKDLEELVKKHLTAEKDENFEVTLIDKTTKIDYNSNTTLYARDQFPQWSYNFVESDMKKYLKKYKYISSNTNKIEIFKVYDFLTHMRNGINFQKANEKASVVAPVTKIIYKLINNDTQIEITNELGNNISFLTNLTEWENKIIVYDSANNKWRSSLTGWVKIFERILNTNAQDSLGQRDLTNALKSSFASYFLEYTDAVVICHEDNYKYLTNDEKNITPILVTSDRYLRVNYRLINIYIGYNNMHIYKRLNFFGKFTKIAGIVLKSSLANIEKDLGVMPFRMLYKYQSISTLNRDDYWFDGFTYTIRSGYDTTKKIIVDKNNFIQPTRFYVGKKYLKNITATQKNTIKNYNNFDKEIEQARLDTAKTLLIEASESSYFLYDNLNLIRETFVSELQKKVYLIGGISFFDRTYEDGKMFLIKTNNKMKFDVRKNEEINHFDFNLSPNLMIVATEKMSRVGQKRKMTQITETVLVKALQSYDRYTILNPLEVNLRSNYLNEKINEFKGFVYEVMLKNILFSSSITNDTQNVFVTCQNLNSAKKALINGKIYGVLGLL